MAQHDIVLLAKARRYATTGHGREVRMGCGLSLREMAEAVGIATSSLWRWEHGERVPRGSSAAQWARLVDELQAEGGQAA